MTVAGGAIELKFVGKHGVDREARLARRAWARRAGKLLKLAGGEPFLQYRGRDGGWHPLSAANVAEYLHGAAGDRFTAKDFRSWHGSRVALEVVMKADAADDPKAVKLAAEDAAAAFLGNTRAVCREYYVHPAVTAAIGRPAPKPVRGRGLRRSERRLLRLLEEAPTAGSA